LGKATLAVVVLGIAVVACDSDGVSPTGAPASDGVAWHRVVFGDNVVAAYVLVRGGEAALVDTGTESLAGAGVIEDALDAAGIGWGAVGHVLLTHLHEDHRGNLPAVMTLASEATGYAGAADIPALELESPRPLTAVGDGDEVFGLEIIETPGHTPGHISVLDPVAGLLVAGDALNGAGRPGIGSPTAAATVAGPNPAATRDLALANESVKKLAGFTFDTIVFGHGKPVEGDADEQVAALAAEL
jgi:glyoxylase-like metal-dependent hydrolase (beta-lactamase superfamily II)